MTGGGSSDNFVELDQQFLGLLGMNPSLLFIPLAGVVETYNESLARIVEVFSTIRFHKIETCTDLASLNWEELRRFDAIYIDGGNTFRLMEHIHNSHFYELTKRFLHHGGVVNGDSAGAIIMGSHIETAHFGENPDPNESNIKSYQGLNLLGDWAIHCHYQASREDKEITAFVREFGFPVIAIPEEAGLMIENQILRPVGPTPVTIFTGAKPFRLSDSDLYNLNLL